MLPKLKLFILLVLFASSVFGQNRFVKRGEKAFQRGDYPEAIAHFRNVKEKNPSINRKIAESFYFLGDEEQAEKYYLKIYDSEKTPSDLLNLSQIYLGHNNYEAAILFSQRALEAGIDSTFVKNRIQAIREVLESKAKGKDFALQAISVQPKSKCLGLAYFSEGLVFSDPKTGKPGAEKNLQLFLAKREDDSFLAPKAFAETMEERTDVGAVCFSSDETLMYYTRWYSRKGKQQMEIVEAVKRNGKWVAKSLLPLTNRRYSCCYPSLSPDGNSLYFSSDKPGGFGGMDLYVSQKNGSSWSEPINLGGVINTSRNEIYPRIVKNNQLSFSSDGHVGYGAFDLLFSTLDNIGNWGVPQNAGFSYNSAYNDYSLVEIPGEHIFLLVSDRDEKGLKDRIYQLSDQQKESIHLLVKDAVSQERIAGATVRIDRAVADNKMANTEMTNDAGLCVFQVFKSDFDQGLLSIRVEKEGYQDQRLEFSALGSNRNPELFLQRKLIEEPVAFVSELEPVAFPDKKKAFQNIYFDSGAMELSKEGMEILDRLIAYWKQSPNMRLIINGHTDSRGDAAMNQLFSLKRAMMARDYLMEQGMLETEITVNSFGEQFIVNGCVDGVECSENEHRENRRLELILVL